jgi:ADP-heptose:LPS heptosyltransferase
MNILIVRLGALGDIVHAIPAAAAIRAAMPNARIDWIVDARHSPVLELVTAIDRIVRIHGRGVAAWSDAVRRLRETPYDVALDLQGLMKSAVRRVARRWLFDLAPARKGSPALLFGNGQWCPASAGPR